MPELELKSMEDALWQHSEAVEKHVSDRFESWYHSTPILNQAIGRLLGMMSEKMSEGLNHFNAECDAAIERNLGGNRHGNAVARFTLMAGHDVTLLPLLHGLGAWGKLKKKWPMYASSIIFEVLRCSNTKQSFVRAFYYSGSNEDAEKNQIEMQEIFFGDNFSMIIF